MSQGTLARHFSFSPSSVRFVVNVGASSVTFRHFQHSQSARSGPTSPSGCVALEVAHGLVGDPTPTGKMVASMPACTLRRMQVVLAAKVPTMIRGLSTVDQFIETSEKSRCSILIHLLVAVGRP